MTTLKLGIALGVAFSLSGCLLTGSNNGTPGALALTPGGTATTVAPTPAPAPTTNTAQDRINAAANTMVTTTQLTGTANYKGDVLVDTIANSDPGDYLVGDLDIDMNFDQKTNNPMSGTATNFRGQLGGQDIALNGTLSTSDPLNGSPVNEIGENSFAVPAPGSGTVFQTGMSLSMAGTITDPSGNPDNSGDALMTLQGTFRGPDGQLVHGAAGGLFEPDSGGVVNLGGQFQLERQ